MSPPPTTTARIEACLHQMDPANRDDLARLLEHAQGRLRRLASQMMNGFLWLRRWEESADVFQKAQVRLCRALPDEQPATASHFFRLSALQIRRALLDMARYYGLRAVVAGECRSPRDGLPDERPAAAQRLAAVHDAVESLPPDLREVVDLIYYQGLTQEEAAEMLQVCRRTVQMRWADARLRLRDLLLDD